MRIITWNTQGAVLSEGKLQQVVNYGPDVICHQQCAFAIWLSKLRHESCQKLLLQKRSFTLIHNNDRRHEHPCFYVAR